MRRFYRILAMVLAIITVWTVVPMSVFAESWFEADTETETEGNVTSAKVTLSVAPELLLTYLKNGDKAALVEGISLGGLRDAFAKEDLIEIFSKEELQNVADMLLEQIEIEVLLGCLDLDALIKGADMDALIAKIKEIPNLQDYVRDYDKLMSYLGDGELLKAVESGCIDTDALIADHVDSLVDLVLELDSETIAALIDVETVLELEEIEFSDVLNKYYIEHTVTFDTLFNSYIDQTAMLDYLHDRFENLKHALHDYISPEGLEAFLAVHGNDCIPYMDLDVLREMVADHVSDYAGLKKYLVRAEFYALVRSMDYNDLKPYVDEAQAKKLIIDNELIDLETLADFVVIGDGTEIDIEGLLSSGLIKENVIKALYSGGAIDLGSADITEARKIILDNDLLSAEEMIDYIDLHATVLDMDRLLDDAVLITDGVRDRLTVGGAILPNGDINYDIAKAIILDEQLIAPEKLIPYFELSNSAIDVSGLLASNLIDGEICNALIDGGAVTLDACVKRAEAKDVIRGDKTLIDIKKLVDYVNLDTCELKVADLMVKPELMTDGVYDVLIEGVWVDGIKTADGAVNVRGMLTAQPPLLDLQTLHEKGAVDIKKMISGADKLFTIDELERAEVIDYETILVGDPSKNLAGMNPEWLVNEQYKVFDLREMLSETEKHDALFTVEELAGKGIVKLDALAEEYGYDNLVDMDILEAQIDALADKSVLVDCIKSTSDLVSAVGAKKALNATGKSYGELIDLYVTDVSAFFEVLGVDSILNKLSSDGELGNVLDLSALVKTLGVPALLDIVGIQNVINQVMNRETLTTLIKALDSDTYVSVLTYALGVLERNVYEIKINDTVITVKDGTLLFINPSLLAETVLNELVPELEELVKIEENNGVIFSTSVSITYASADTDGEKITKNLTVEGVVADGVDRVQKAAERFKELTERYFIYDFTDGVLTFDLRLPSKLATALRTALEKLSAQDDPALQELRDEILDLYNANANDFTAFVSGLTLEQIVALLNTVDASSFGAAYGKVMTNQYVELMLSYIKSATGQDFTDLTPEDLLIKAGEIPTLDKICEKIEAKLGREIGAFDRLPAKDPVEILEGLAAKKGIDVDLKKILEDAAKEDDPLAALYESFVFRVENSEEIYENVKGRIVSKAEKLLDSKYAEKLAGIRLDDLYTGNGEFKYSKLIAIDPMVHVERMTEKAISLLCGKVSLPEDLVERTAQIILSYFMEGTELTLGLDGTLHATGMYKITFHDVVGGQLKPIRTAYLPEGTDLALVQPYESESQYRFVGWKDPATGEILEKMPARDTEVVVHLEDGIYRVYFYAWDTGKLLSDVVEVTAGDSLGAYRDQMNAVVRKYLGQQIPDKNILWKNHSDGSDFTGWSLPINGDLSLTWKHFYDVTVVNPETGESADTLTVPAGTVLAGSVYLETMNGIVRNKLKHPTLPDANISWVDYTTGESYVLNSKVMEDLSLSWSVVYTVTVKNPKDGQTVSTVFVKHGESLADHLAALNEIVRDKLSKNDTQLPDANIEWYDAADTTKTVFDSEKLNEKVLSDTAISWKHYFNVTVVDPITAQGVEVLRVPAGDSLRMHLSALNQAVKNALKDTHPKLADENIVWYNTASEKLDLDNTLVNDPLNVTWKLGFTVTVVYGASEETVKTVQVAEGESLSDILAELNDAIRSYLKNSAILDENIDWYDCADPDKKVLDSAALAKDIVSNLKLSCSCYFSVAVNDPNGQVMEGLSFRVPFGNAMSDAQIEKIKTTVLSYIRTTLGLSYIQAEDITYLLGDTEFTGWDAILTNNAVLTWTYAQYYKVEVWEPESLGGELLYTVNVLSGHQLSDAQYAAILSEIRRAHYADRDDLPDADIILITPDGESFGTPVINADTKITWRLAEYYDVEIFYTDKESGEWVSKVFVAREGNIFYSSWSAYEQILALRESVAGPAPEDYEYVWVKVDADGNVTEEVFYEQTAITEDLRLAWKLVYSAPRYSITVVDPEDPEKVLWKAEGLKRKTHVVTYLSEQMYNGTEESVWSWLQALVAASDPHIVDYVHEYTFSWRQVIAGNASGIFNLENYSLNSDLTFTWKYTKEDDATLGIVGFDGYQIILDGNTNTWFVRIDSAWREDAPIEFIMETDFLENAMASGASICFDSDVSTHRIELSASLLAKLYSAAKVMDEKFECVNLHYSYDEGKSVFDFANANDLSGSYYFEIDFYLNGTEKGNVIKLGDFATAHDPENGVSADVMITLPFGIVANVNGVKTFVCFEDASAPGGYREYELTSYDLQKQTVSFAAPHFSSVAINNQYRISTSLPHLLAGGIAEDLLTKLPQNEDIAFYPIDLTADEYYPAGAKIPLRTITGKDDHLAKVEITRTVVFGSDGTELSTLPASGSYTMPAQPIDLRFEIAPKIYYVFYYVDGALKNDLTRAYTAYMIETEEAREALKWEILSLDSLGADYSEEDGWSWLGFDDRSLGTANMYLFLVRSTSEDTLHEKTVEVIFYAEDGVTELSRITYKVTELVDVAVIPTVESILGTEADAVRSAHWVNLADGKRVPSGYTLAEWKALLAESESISLGVAYVYRSFSIYTDGNVKVLLGEDEARTAVAGAELTVAVSTKADGMIPNLLVKTASGEILVKVSGKESAVFVMPAEDVTVTVSYTVANVTYTDHEGNVQSGVPGEGKVLPPLVIERGMALDLTRVPDGLVLIGVETDGDRLILTYQYTVGENTDAKALLEALQAALTAVEYRNRFVINGKVFANAEDALAFICGEADFKDWSDTVDQNLHFGSFEQETAEFPWIVILILGILLLLILLIAIFYLLYIKGVFKPNVFFKVITAIVSVFFALCMALARAWAAVIRLFGINEERLMRDFSKKKKNPKTLEESLDALKQADPNYSARESEIASRIATKTESVAEELSFTDDSDASEDAKNQ